MARVDLISQRRINELISHLPGVVDAVYDEAVDLKRRAEFKLAEHRREGHTRIVLERSIPDAIVSLVDTDNNKGEPAAHAIEFGHHSKSGKWIPGLYVISGGLNNRG